MNRQIFYARIRKEFGGLNQSQVDGINAILDAWERDYSDLDYRWLAYCLATSWHETARKMKPIHEYGRRSYFNKYEPGTRIGKRLGNTVKGDGYRFRGRGYVQLTGRRNYAFASRKLGIDLVSNPDLALEPSIAAKIMFEGMMHGWFTGRKLANYIKPGGKADYVHARRIINGMDRAKTIAGYASTFAAALRAARTPDQKPQPLAAIPGEAKSEATPEPQEKEDTGIPDTYDLPRRKSKLESTTVRAVVTGGGSAAYATWEVISSVKDHATQIVLILCLTGIILSLLWIFRERLKKLARGI